MLKVKKPKKVRKRRKAAGPAGRTPGVGPDPPDVTAASPSSPFPVSSTTDSPQHSATPSSNPGQRPVTEIKLESGTREGEDEGYESHLGPHPLEERKGKEADTRPQAGGKTPPRPSPGPDRAFPGPLAFGEASSAQERKADVSAWQFFDPDEADASRATCTLCLASVSQRKVKGHLMTTALKRHLEGKHPLEWGEKAGKRKRASGGKRKEEEGEREGVQAPGGAGPPLSPVAGPAPDASAFRRGIGSESDSEDEEKRRIEILIAQLARDESNRKQRKGDHPFRCRGRGRGQGRKPGPQPGHQKPPSLETPVGAGTPSPGSLSSASLPLVPSGIRHRRSISAVWQFFYIDCNNVSRAICTLCQASVSRGKLRAHFGTTGLKRHLECKHPLEWGRNRACPSAGRGKRVGEEEEEEEEEEPVTSSLGEAALGPGRTLASSDRWGEEPEPAGGDVGGRYAPDHPRARAWNHSIAELLCGTTLPDSFVASRPFRRFMARADPCYLVPSPDFFSHEARPRLHGAVRLRVLRDLKRAEGGRIHLAAHVSTRHPAVDFLSLTAHWVTSDPAGGGGRRRQAVLSVRGLPKERPPGGQLEQQELARQTRSWLAPHSLSPGFTVAGGGCPGLERAVREAGHAHVPCFAHCLGLLVGGFLHHHHSVQLAVGTARAALAHLRRFPEAQRLLARLQRESGLLPAGRAWPEETGRWDSTYRLLEWLAERQLPLQECAAQRRLGEAGAKLTPSLWSLVGSLVALLQPFEMAAREVEAAGASLSQVLPQVRYLHIFLRQIRGRFEAAGGGEPGAAGRLAESLALQLATDHRLNELFHHEAYVLATLLDPRFKGKMEAILPLGSDVDHWKQVLVRKVKEIMVASACPPRAPQSPPDFRDFPADVAPGRRGTGRPSQGRKGYRRPEKGGGKGAAAAPLIHKEKTLTEHLEGVGLLASEGKGASLSTESHSACVMVDKYLRDTQTVGARDDPLAYWERRRGLWPALAQLAVLYLSCPPSGASSEHLFGSPDGPAESQSRPLEVEAVEDLLFLKTNLENFPDYSPPPLVFSSDPDPGGVCDREGEKRPA
ncbi:ZBED6 C-terminal-like protein [Ornithorhynchus anatinus]|uniref:BED-type domain-containing protein n=1 Tax=Ornithorhynchus anatinus TaxID=9258 RepID=A0A6I8NNT7_ORNAN|nr:ZBED6 C-terminal-like protein [Ornithorhynchus anatinus]